MRRVVDAEVSDTIHKVLRYCDSTSYLLKEDFALTQQFRSSTDCVLRVAEHMVLLSDQTQEILEQML